MKRASEITKRAAAVLLSLALFCAPGTSAWAQTAINAAAVQAPLGGQSGLAGVAGMSVAQSPDIKLANLPLVLSGTLGTPSMPAPVINPTLTPAPGLGQPLQAAQAATLQPASARAAAAPAAAAQSAAVAVDMQPAPQSAMPTQGMERHPVVEMLNAASKAGVSLPQNLSTPEDFAKMKAAAEALPAGRARDNLLAFVHAMSLPDSAGKAGELSKIYDNASLVPSAEPTKAEGFWASVAGSRSRLIPSGLKKYAAQKAESQRAKAKTIDTDKLLVPAEKMRWVPDEKELPESTRLLKPEMDKVVGQDRALKAIEFGAKMPGPGYNLIVSGEEGSGRETAVRAILKKVAAGMPTPGDIVQAVDFSEKKLAFLELGPGAGKAFSAAVDSVLDAMSTLPEVVQGPEFQQAVKELQADFQKEAKEKQKALDAETAKIRIRGEFGLKVEIRQTGENTVGIAATITKDGKAVKPEEIDQLIQGKGYTKEELLAEMQEAAQPVIEKYAELLRENEKGAEAIQAQMQQLVGQAASQILKQAAAPLLQIASGQDQDNPVMKALREKMEKRQAEFDAEVAKVQVGPFGLYLAASAQGLQLVLTYQGMPVSPEAFEELKKAGAVDKDATYEGLAKQAMAAAKPLIAKLKEMMAANQKDMAEAKRNMPKPTEKQRIVVAWAKSFLQHVASNVGLFMAQGKEGVPEPKAMYGVNLVVDNGRTKGAPIVYEDHPTKLLSHMAKDEETGAPKLEFGSFSKANGGYLVLNLLDVLREGVYAPLMTMLRTGKPLVLVHNSEGKVVDVQQLGMPADVKVVLIASPMLRMMLQHNDEDFPALFKAAAEFDHSFEIAADNIAYYLKLIRTAIEKSTGELLHMTRDAISAVLEFASRSAESNSRLTTRFGPVQDLMRESSFYAKQAGHEMVTREDVDRALSERDERNGGMKRHMHDIYSKGIFTIQIEGGAVGQINGLAVMGDFGVPARITVRTVAGSGVVSADQIAGTTGSSFIKALAILEGFLKGLFGKDKPMPAQLRISFEQNYGGIDGDSATQTQIYAALSSMSGLPIKQGIAITGSADQFGNVQAIGGVNHKIEGYYDVAKEMLRREGKEMTGEQGVIIPTSNVGDLTLRPDIVEAVKAGKFHIWAVSHVGQGVEILMGQPYSEVLLKVQQNLGKMR